MSWNDYPPYARNKIIKCLENGKNTRGNNTLEQQGIVTIFCRTSHEGVQGEILIKILVRKRFRHLLKPFKFQNIYHKKS